MEELINSKRKKIVTKIISELHSEDSSLYYVDTSSISTLVVDRIKSGKLSKADFELMDGLSSRDILNLISYNSNCC